MKSKIKKEFERRLVRLKRSCLYSLDSGTIVSDFYPALWSVISYLYCKSPKELIKK